MSDLVFVEGDLDAADLDALAGFLVDPLLQTGTWDVPTAPGVEVTFLPGVTDTAAATLLHAAGAARGRRHRRRHRPARRVRPAVDDAVADVWCGASSPTR